MSDKAFWENSVVPAREIEAAGDAIRMLFEQSDREERGGPHWYYIAQVALEAAFEERLVSTLLHMRCKETRTDGGGGSSSCDTESRQTQSPDR